MSCIKCSQKYDQSVSWNSQLCNSCDSKRICTKCYKNYIAIKEYQQLCDTCVYEIKNSIPENLNKSDYYLDYKLVITVEQTIVAHEPNQYCYKPTNDYVQNAVYIIPPTYHYHKLYTKRTYNLPKLFDNTDIDDEGEISIDNPKLQKFINFKTTEFTDIKFCHNCTPSEVRIVKVQIRKRGERKITLY
jgi:hypothetical protein